MNDINSDPEITAVQKHSPQNAQEVERVVGKGQSDTITRQQAQIDALAQEIKS